jgi:hypothetical protein
MLGNATFELLSKAIRLHQLVIDVAVDPTRRTRPGPRCDRIQADPRTIPLGRCSVGDGRGSSGSFPYRQARLSEADISGQHSAVDAGLGALRVQTLVDPATLYWASVAYVHEPLLLSLGRLSFVNQQVSR